jgi:ABC-type nitrate/sulfonate/bicarbonate transport system substrate-binding protein
MSIDALAAHQGVRWLFEDRKGAAIAYNKEIGWPQPIHCVIVKTEIVDKDPSVPARLTRAFLEAVKLPSERSNVHAMSYHLTAAEEAEAVGADFTPAGLKGRNREAIARMLDLCWKDGYIDRGRPFRVDEYFDKSTLAL